MALPLLLDRSLCLTCGHVGCRDSSKGMHTRLNVTASRDGDIYIYYKTCQTLKNLSVGVERSLETIFCSIKWSGDP
jgi:hypothetical protein